MKVHLEVAVCLLIIWIFLSKKHDKIQFKVCNKMNLGSFPHPELTKI